MHKPFEATFLTVYSHNFVSWLLHCVGPQNLIICLVCLDKNVIAVDESQLMEFQFSSCQRD